MAYKVAGVLLLLLLQMTHIGCDGVVGSPRVRDACGVCGGNNSTCQIISGLFTEPYLREGYQLVVQIPAGACSIHIEELQPTSNYLALRDSNQEFILNGDWNIDNSGQYQGAGASFVYRRQSSTKGETIAAVGPITQPVDIFILYRQANRGIKYEYAIKRNNSFSSVLPRLPTEQGLVPALPLLPAQPGLQPRQPHRNALRQPAGGRQRQATQPPLPPAVPGLPRTVPSIYSHQPGRPPHKPGRRRRPATPSSSSSGRRDQSTGRRGSVQGSGRRRGMVQRPGPPPQVPQTATSRPAGTGQRPVRTGTGTHRRRGRRRRRRRFQWVVHGYSDCTKSCGGGTQVPEVVCMRRKRKELAPDSKCSRRRKPRARPVPCNTAPCPVSAAAGWEANEWSACSTSCGSGHQTRTFLCVRAGQPVEGTECVGRPKEPSTQPCNPGPCQPALRWNVGQWSACSVSCGWGTRTRSVTCTRPRSSGWCPEAERPRDMAPCRRRECPPVSDPAGAADQPAGWMVTDWTHQCSAECGQGVQSRGVACGGGPGSCDVTERPDDTRPCKTDRGCSGIWFTGPWSQCSRECGVGGQATRTVLCVRQSAGQFSVTSDLSCLGSPRPATRQACGAEPGGRCAPRWFTADWAACSASCGGGQQIRLVACVGTDGRLAAGCPPAERPAERRDCRQADCPGTASASESSDPASDSGIPPIGKKPGQKSSLKPSLGPEYQTVEDPENEIQVGPPDAPTVDHVAQLAVDESLWTNQLRAHTANRTLMARKARPTGGSDSIPFETPSELPASESPGVVSTEGVANGSVEPSTSTRQQSDLAAGIGQQSDPEVTAAQQSDPEVTAAEQSDLARRQSDPAAALGDAPDPGIADRTGDLGTESALRSGQPSSPAADSAEEPAPVTAQPETTGAGGGQVSGQPGQPDGGAGHSDGGGGGLGRTNQSGRGGSVSGDSTDSCTDKVSHCGLVKRARLCQTSYYASSCCASCRQIR